MSRFIFFPFPVAAALVFLTFSSLLLPTGTCAAASSQGRTVYVPVYSMVYTGDRAVPIRLASTLSIRNTDEKNPIRITGVDYYSSEGRLVRKMLSSPRSLGPLASTSIFIKEKDVTGGFSSSFLVRWEAEGKVSSPIIECVNIGAYSGLGISFVTMGREVR